MYLSLLPYLVTLIHNTKVSTLHPFASLEDKQPDHLRDICRCNTRRSVGARHASAGRMVSRSLLPSLARLGGRRVLFSPATEVAGWRGGLLPRPSAFADLLRGWLGLGTEAMAGASRGSDSQHKSRQRRPMLA